MNITPVAKGLAQIGRYALTRKAEQRAFKEKTELEQMREDAWHRRLREETKIQESMKKLLVQQHGKEQEEETKRKAIEEQFGFEKWQQLQAYKERELGLKEREYGAKKKAGWFQRDSTKIPKITLGGESIQQIRTGITTTKPQSERDITGKVMGWAFSSPEYEGLHKEYLAKQELFKRGITDKVLKDKKIKYDILLARLEAGENIDAVLAELGLKVNAKKPTEAEFGPFLEDMFKTPEEAVAHYKANPTQDTWERVAKILREKFKVQ